LGGALINTQFVSNIIFSAFSSPLVAALAKTLRAVLSDLPNFSPAAIFELFYDQKMISDTNTMTVQVPPKSPELRYPWPYTLSLLTSKTFRIRFIHCRFNIANILIRIFPSIFWHHCIIIEITFSAWTFFQLSYPFPSFYFQRCPD
jgi:hypothetical protein